MKNSMRAICGVLFAALLATSGTAGASSLSDSTKETVRTVKNAFITVKARTAAPFSHIMFCKATPVECLAQGDADPVQLDRNKLAELRQVNRNINRQIIARSEVASYAGEDNWTLSPTAGDCEDFAITKRHTLVKMGWPSSSLRLAIVRTAWGEGHLVLVVRTSKGDYVLDNLTNAVRLWNATGLKWDMIQSSENPRNWHRI
jgi:predicted transglutaminase-like cysteine proteinase